MPLIGNGATLIENSTPFPVHSYYTSGYKALRRKKRKASAMGRNRTDCKKQKKEHRSDSSSDTQEPTSMTMALSTPRTNQASKSELPSLYTEELGLTGVKATLSGPILSGPQASFDIPMTSEEEHRRKRRKMRFSVTVSSTDDAPEALATELSAPRVGASTVLGKRKASRKDGGSAFIGRCHNLEKPYLRLTTFPVAEQVRPLGVLKKSLALIKSRYIKTEDFEWANEQLKSVRQDITVQGIKTDFVLEVYETHARILLEHGDLNEFNQCQTMIRTLTTGISGSQTDDDSTTEDQFESISGTTSSVILNQADEAADEFGGYRLLYALVQNSSVDVTKELRNAKNLVNREETRSKQDPQRIQRTISCRHAALVVKAVTHQDYHAFFKLYQAAPHLSAYLMDFLVKRVRMGAYNRIIATYRPTISVEYFRGALCFQDLEETRQFLKKNGAVFVRENGEIPFWIDCKESSKM